MIQEDESSPSVFTDAGYDWLNEMLEALKENNYKKSINLGHHDSWSSRSYKHGRVPEIHPEFGRLVMESKDPQYLLISTHDDTWDVTHKTMPSSVRPDDHPNYTVENFGKVRIYNEAVARNVDDLFVPITGWDGHNFRWITMPVVTNHQPSDGGTSKADPLKHELKSRDSNWVIHDEEVGDYKGDRVLVDYGMCWYDGSWKVSESQLFDG